MPIVPADNQADLQDIKNMFSGGIVNGFRWSYGLFDPQAFRYSIGEPTVRTDPMEYFPSGYKKCECGHCIAEVNELIHAANDTTVDWGKDDYPLPLWCEQYTHFCTDVGIDFHPRFCRCSRCRAVRNLHNNRVCFVYKARRRCQYENAVADVSSAVRSGLGLSHGGNPMLPFLSHRMLQQVASAEQLNASGSSVQLINGLNNHKDKYDIEDIVKFFSGKTLKSFCKKNIKQVKLNKGNKYMTSNITVFLKNAQDRAGRKICSDAWSIVLDFLGKEWLKDQMD